MSEDAWEAPEPAPRRGISAERAGAGLVLLAEVGRFGAGLVFLALREARLVASGVIAADVVLTAGLLLLAASKPRSWWFRGATAAWVALVGMGLLGLVSSMPQGGRPLLFVALVLGCRGRFVRRGRTLMQRVAEGSVALLLVTQALGWMVRLVPVEVWTEGQLTALAVLTALFQVLGHLGAFGVLVGVVVGRRG